MGSAYSNTVQIQVTPAIAPPILAAAFNANGTSALLTWSEATPGIGSFLLYRDSNQQGYELLETLAGTVFEYMDEIPLDPSSDQNEVSYYLIATIGTAQSGPSNEVSNYAGV